MIDLSPASLLVEGAKRLGIDLSTEAIIGFSLYLQEILRWSPITDLVSRTDPEFIIRKHFLDSLAVSPLILADCRLVDLGSGAGFPGMILAMVQPSRTVVLLEARRKRVSFLKHVIRKTKLKNIHVYEGRVETLAQEPFLQGVFDAAITRATWNLETFLRHACPFLREGGMGLIMKGPEGDKEFSRLPEHGKLPNFCFTGRRIYQLPFGPEKRQVFIFTKHVSRDT
jgi:16S rRNA (guanine527-N7)-methyltransferase